MYPYIFAFFIGVGITLIGSFLYVRGLKARFESDIRLAEYRGRVARECEIEEMLELEGISL